MAPASLSLAPHGRTSRNSGAPRHEIVPRGADSKRLTWYKYRDSMSRRKLGELDCIIRDSQERTRSCTQAGLSRMLGTGYRLPALYA